mgnify:FL=1
MHKIELTPEEIQHFYNELKRRMFYRPYYLRGNQDMPLGNPYQPWMEDTISKLKPFVKHTYD